MGRPVLLPEFSEPSPRVEIGGGQVGGRRLAQRDFLCAGKSCLQLLGDRLGDFALNREDIRQIAVVPFRPLMLTEVAIKIEDENYYKSWVS